MTLAFSRAISLSREGKRVDCDSVIALLEIEFALVALSLWYPVGQ